ncbi:MAG: DUF1214 domain-containing protein [Brucellaceae bacterium]|nr:DUF1214 domain-containing protein [Brucellaceae bacterium]
MLFFLLRVILVLAIAIGGGAYSAMYVIDHDFGLGAIRFGSWTAYPRRGGVLDNPYSRAQLARSGEVPLGHAEGLAFTAATDSTGAALDRTCLYRLSGKVPPARYWTLYAAAGNPARIVSGAGSLPASLHSRQLMRDTDNAFDIAVSPHAQPGNWLPVAGGGSMRLVLTLYDTPVSADNSLSELALPQITREGCGA